MTSINTTDYPDFSGPPPANNIYVFFGTPTTGETIGPFYVGQSQALYMQANFAGDYPDALAIFFHPNPSFGSDIFGGAGYDSASPLVIADMITPLGPYMFIEAITEGGPVHDLGQLALYTAIRPESSLSPSFSPYLLGQTPDTCPGSGTVTESMPVSVVGAAQLMVQVNTPGGDLTFLPTDTSVIGTPTTLGSKRVLDTDGLVTYPFFLASSSPSVIVVNNTATDTDFTLTVMTTRGLT